MKTIKTILLTAILFAVVFNSNNAFANKWRVNILSNYQVQSVPYTYGENFGGTQQHPVFKQLDDVIASNSFFDNDTIYLEGCPTNTSYDAITLFRPVVIIGTGYFLNHNEKSSNDFAVSNLNSISFSFTSGSSSAGSTLIGVNITSQFGIEVHVDDITISRCYLNPNAEILIWENLSSINITQNYFDNTATPNTITGIAFSQFGGVTDLRINHNIFKRTLYVASNDNATGGTTYMVQECKNNTFDLPAVSGNPSLRMDCNSFHNNIIMTPSASLNINSGIASGSVTNNTAPGPSQFDYSATYNNKQVANISALFVLPSISEDASYMLDAGSSFNYPGLGGGDRGAFGGIFPSLSYTLSGLPPIPVIYDVYTSGQVNNGQLPVVVKARTIK